MSITFPTLPKENSAIYAIQTSFDSNLFAGGVFDAAGAGAIKKRSVATAVAKWRPWNNQLDTVVQMIAPHEVASQVKHEFLTMDEYLQDKAVGIVDGTAGTQINQSGTFTGTTTGNFTVDDSTTKNGHVFKVGDKVRYVNNNSTYTYALVTSVTLIAGQKAVLGLTTFSGNLVQSAATAAIERLERVLGADRNFTPQPRQSIGTMDYSYVQKMAYEIAWTNRSQNEDHYYDLVAEAEKQLYTELRVGRAKAFLYSQLGIVNITNSAGNADKVYSTIGIYPAVNTANSYSATITSGGIFDASLFKRAWYDFVAKMFGGFSGGNNVRQFYCNASFAQFFARAFEDKQGSWGNEFIAGVKSSVYEDPLVGRIDIIYEPLLDWQHPTPNGGIIGSSPKAFGILIPVQDTVRRFTLQNEGTYAETFKVSGGDVEMITRVGTSEGQYLVNTNYACTFSEA